MRIEDQIIEDWEQRPPGSFEGMSVHISSEAYGAMLKEYVHRCIEAFGISCCMKMINHYKLKISDFVKCTIIKSY